MAALVAVVLLLGAGIGAAVGVASKQTLAATTILITISIAIFLISGNEDSLREGMHSFMHLATAPDQTGLWIGLGVAAIVGLGVGMLTVRRTFRSAIT